MKVLILAPQPFYQERGTPIAVKILTEALVAKYTSNNDRIDLLTYHEGIDIELTRVNHYRSWAPSWLTNIRPGISIKKILADCFFFLKTISLIYKHRSDQYTLIHAIEESVFIAWFIKITCSIHYIYDMDSSLVQQLTDKWKIFSFCKSLLRTFECIVFKSSTMVLPVCQALADEALAKQAKNIHILHDIVTLQNIYCNDVSIRGEFSITPDKNVIMYIGNLEPYQGIELLISAYDFISSKYPETILLIVGGLSEDISKLKLKWEHLINRKQLVFSGPRPFKYLATYLNEANILASPRLEGVNTPMKIYNYLGAGKPIIATDIISHTQVLDNSVAKLCLPNYLDFATNLESLIVNKDLQKTLGNNALQLAESKYSFKVFQEKLNLAYNELESLVGNNHENYG
jgi:glycosyltransferase involved in cell wall biosynthesis